MKFQLTLPAQMKNKFHLAQLDLTFNQSPHILGKVGEEVDNLIMWLDTYILFQELINETYSEFCIILKEEMECNLPKIRSSKKYHHHKP